MLVPILKEQLSFTTGHYSYIVAAFQISYVPMQPIAGYATDFIGLRLGYFVFALIWGTAAALHASAGSWSIMALFRGILSIGKAAAIPSAVKTATVWFPPKERSIASGWFLTGTSIGAMITPPLVVWRSVMWSWQVPFIITRLMAVGVAAERC